MYQSFHCESSAGSEKLHLFPDLALLIAGEGLVPVFEFVEYRDFPHILKYSLWDYSCQEYSV
jgi:hypothetical protein